MDLNVMMTLTGDEIHEKIPYALICETMGGSRWNTGKRQAAFREAFTEAEARKCRELYSKAHKWHLVKGVPETETMNCRTFCLWQRLGLFCGSL